MATVITRAFEHWQAGQVLNNLPARPDTIIFAHVPGLDPAADINPDEGIPADGQIVHRDVVAQYGMINDSAVAYSVVLDTRVGDFTFNWIGLVDAASNTLCMIVHTPAQQKIATTNGVQGNNITRTFLMEFAGAAEASQITVSAQTWQIDFSARLRGIDEVCRLANLDYYGHAAFFGDGFSVSKDGDKYRVKAGLAYVGGIRALLADDALLEAATGNVVYADVSYQGSVLSEFAPIIHLGVKDSAGDFDDYTDANGFAHYITPLALITASGEEDKRDANPFDKAIDDINAALKEHEKSRDHPDATLNAKGFTQLSSAINSTSETHAATSKAVKTANDAALKIEKNLSDLNDTTLARTNIGAADANDVVSKKNGGTFDKSIDVKGVVTSREKVECRSPGNDNYSSGFNCYVNDSGVITDYISTHYAIEPQWLFSTKLELPTRKVTLSVNGDIKSGGTITAGGEGGAQIYRDGNIAGPAWGPIGDLFSYINSIKSGAITSVRLGAQSSSDGAIGPIPAGCYLVGTSGSWNIFRPLQFLQNGIWVTAGNI
ncbi:phage tail-collar fiber domain-containing protein [Yersinia pseudotuberculosis]|uniref:phage tail-collar fiber domain-containing protein n=1 Tax=Yersinia pseudotuberculosis TaxID=633 RepID=UPI0005DD4AE5|nr:phage tail protein [Yersinia pseudotuberculosis]MCF1165149.1 phage tail protein [Yersinia pseudotuberculosis]CQH25252.1 tail fiber repeat 2-containing protein [Yersinia pseudotuberculosis]